MYYQSTLPAYDLATPAAGLGEYFQASAGMGEYFQASASPGLAGLGMVCATGICGLGQPETEAAAPEIPIAVAAVVGIGLLALGGYLSYQAGKAMSPPGKNWGGWGVPGMFFGVPWFGVMGIISNTERGR